MNTVRKTLLLVAWKKRLFARMVHVVHRSCSQSFFSRRSRAGAIFSAALLAVLICAPLSFLQAEEFTSSNFILRDPVITVSGGRSTSTTFEFFSSTGQPTIGESTSNNFIYRAGFLYFEGEQSSTTSPATGGGSSSGSVGTALGAITFSGKGYPNGTVVILKDTQIAQVVTADSDGNFSARLTNIYDADYVFSLYGKDYTGKASRLLVFPVKGVSGKNTEIKSILIPPTISRDKKAVAAGGTIMLSGQTIKNTTVTITVTGSAGETVLEVDSDVEGKYSYLFNASILEQGSYSVISQVLFEGSLAVSSPIIFLIGNETIFEETPTCPERGDLNGDCAVNLIDFSMLIYWFDRLDVPPRVDLDANGVANLIDFSIMAYYWTG